MSVLRDLQTRAAARPAHIVLSEGHDPRVVAGALAALDAGLGPITLVGPAAEINQQLARANAVGSKALNIQDPETSPLTATYAALYHELRKHKGISEELAAQQARDPLMFAALMVRNGDADGTIRSVLP